MKLLKQHGVWRIKVVSLLALFAGIFFSAPGDALQIGDRVQANGTVNVRSTPAGNFLGTQTSGNQGNIIGGPQTASLSGTSYTWWNVNWDAGVDGWVADIGLTLVTPTPPTPSSPSGGQVITTLTPQLIWSGGSNFSSLQINVSKSPFGTANIIYTSTWLSVGTTSITLPSGVLVAGTDYRWDVTACSGANGTAPCVTSGNATFSTQTVTPTPPTPSSPSGGQVITTLTPQLTWSGGSNFSSLQINMSKSPYGGCPGTGNCVYTSAWLSAGTTSVTVSPALVAGTSYRWDVTACSGASGTGTCVTGSSNAYFSTQTCSYTLTSGSQSFSASGGSGSVGVVAASDCSWTANSSAAWLTITAGSSGSGNGTVSFSVGTNSGTSQRQATITVQGQVFTVTQTAATVPNLKLPLPGGRSWLLTVEVGGLDLWGTVDSFHTGNGYYSLDFDNVTEGGVSVAEVPILAAGAGRVIESGGTGTNYCNTSVASWGYTVVVDHGNGYWTRYAHLKDPPLVSRGTDVVQGQQIGVMGNTGSSCPVDSDGHLHFQVYFNESSSASAGALQGLVIDGRRIEEYKVGTQANPRCYPSTNTTTIGSWSGWQPLPGGGQTGSQPAAVLDSTGTLRLYVQGVDNGLWAKQKSGGSWSDWSRVAGGGSLDGPAAFLDGTAVRLVVRGLDNSLWTALADIPTWQHLGGRTERSPAAVVHAGSPSIFIRGLDGRLYETLKDQTGVWSQWAEVPGSGQSSGQPAAVVDSTGTLHLYIQGIDNSLWMNQVSPTLTWGQWTAGVGGKSSVGPAAILDGDKVRLVVRGLDNRIYTTLSSDIQATQWSSWENLGGQTLNTPAAVRDGNTLHIFVRGMDGRLYMNSRTGGNGSSDSEQSEE